MHDVLDDEVDKPPPTPEAALLPTLLSFLSSSPHFLDIIVQCTRKTEVRSWKTLFKYLPPAKQLFEQALGQGLLVTAGGYLLVMHTLEEEGENDNGPELLNSPMSELPNSLSSDNVQRSQSGQSPIVINTSSDIRAEKEREDQVVRLLSAASEKGEWALCKELARFLMALDSSGRMLREAMSRCGLTNRAESGSNGYFG